MSTRLPGMTPRSSRIPLLALSVALATGCGDSGPTKPEFVAKADAICKEANRDRAALQKRGLTYPAPRTDEELADLLRELERTDRTALKRLRAVPAPKADVAINTRMLDSFEDAFANFAPFITAAAAGDEEEGPGVYFAWLDGLRQPQDMAAKYGLDECAVFGNP